jgi:acetyl-CoA acetyltransferase
MRDVYVAGHGMTTFGKHLDRSLGELTREAVSAALRDAGVDAAAIGYVYFANAAAGLITGQEMIRGQVALKGVELRDATIIDVESACSSGGSAAHLAWLTVASGRADVAMAVGTEKLIHPDKSVSFAAIEAGTDLTLAGGLPEAGGSAMMGAYAQECRDYADKYGPIEDALAAIAVKNRAHAADNPRAQFRSPITTEDVLASRPVADPLRLLTCSPLTDGAAAMVFTAARPSAGRPVRVLGSELRSHEPSGSVVRRAAQAGYESAGLGPDDIDVFQLHDACAFAELLQYEHAGLAEPGGGADAVLSGATRLGGRRPVNTDGGLLSRGHALGATGVAMLVELTEQLQGRSGVRQVDGAARAMAVNAGGWMGDDYATTAVTVLGT